MPPTSQGRYCPDSVPFERPAAGPLPWCSAALAGWTLLGCTSTAPTDRATLDRVALDPSVLGVDVRIEAPDGQAPESYLLVARTRDGDVLRAHCPTGERDAGLSCTAQGVRAESESPLDEVTVKARGTVFATVSATEAARTVHVALEALAEPEGTENYVTGFAADADLDDYAALAQRADTELGTALSVKFYVQDPAGDPHVYFQNTRRYALHHDFVRTVLGETGTVRQFEQSTYAGADRRALAGTVIAYPDLVVKSVRGATLRRPFVLSFFPSDDLTPEQVLLAHRLIEERLQLASLVGEEQRLIYVPAGTEQEQSVAEASDRLRSRDVPWVHRTDLYGGLSVQTLNPGLAYGTLRIANPEDLDATVVSSRDILVLPRLPNDLPVVGGTITEELQTPLSHVNVAARARGTPNIALRNASEDERIEPLLGKLVRFEVTGGSYSLRQATLDEAEAYWASRVPKSLVPAFDLSAEGLPEFDELDFEDSVSVGAKAANLAELARLLGENAPHGFAVPFSAYDEFMTSASVTDVLCADARTACPVASRETGVCERALELCTAAVGRSLFELTERFRADETFEIDSVLRDAALATVRYLITHIAVNAEFAEALDARVEALFGESQVRLRSSSNTEDLLGFSGSGLYESLSAEAHGSRRASLRIRQVWASVWTYRAFEERRYWGVDDRAVRMGVAVNQAFDGELVNGVLITQNIVDPTTAGLYVNVQKGEVSVANPEDGAVAEALSLVPAPGGGAQAARVRFSSLSPDVSLLEEHELNELLLLVNRVQSRFSALYEQNRYVFALDLEFKIVPPDRHIIIKQVRPYVEIAGRVDPPQENDAQ